MSHGVLLFLRLPALALALAFAVLRLETMDSNILDWVDWKPRRRLLAEAGIDIRSVKFPQGGFDILDTLVSELEKLKQ